ncbi:MAG: hypothetical protein MUO23_00760, partial [Anaerolineales bacterium]|nr:hypothetical protein [Anaerolineales bacterium]
MNSPRGRNTLALLIMLLIVAVLVFQFRAGTPKPEQLTLSEVARALATGDVTRIVVDKDELEVVYRDGTSAVSRKEPTSTAVQQLLELGVPPATVSSDGLQWEIKQPSEWTTVLSLITYLLPGLLVVGLIFMMLRQAQGSNNQA